jgi:uncharacterized membrane protein
MTAPEHQHEGSVGEPSAPRFDAVLYAHPSLSPGGFVLFMAVLSMISFTTGALFAVAGAWPVMGFLTLDLALIYAAFHINYRRQRIYETLRLTEDTLVVERVRAGRRTESWEFQPYWLRVAVDDGLRHKSALILTSHGRTLEIGKFLTAGEKYDVARALDTELGRLHGRAA